MHVFLNTGLRTKFGSSRANVEGAHRGHREFAVSEMSRREVGIAADKKGMKFGSGISFVFLKNIDNCEQRSYASRPLGWQSCRALCRSPCTRTLSCVTWVVLSVAPVAHLTIALAALSLPVCLATRTRRRSLLKYRHLRDRSVCSINLTECRPICCRLSDVAAGRILVGCDDLKGDPSQVQV